MKNNFSLAEKINKIIMNNFSKTNVANYIIILSLIFVNSVIELSAEIKFTGPNNNDTNTIELINKELEHPLTKNNNKAVSDAKMLERFLQLTPDKLTRMRLVIEKIEKMSANEKKALSKRLKQYYELEPVVQKSLRNQWDKIPVAERHLLRKHFFDLNPIERETEQAKLTKMKSEERFTYYHEILSTMKNKLRVVNNSGINNNSSSNEIISK